MGYILALDQGTTSSRAIVIAPDLSIRGLGQREFAQFYPQPGWVEHDPEDIWRTTVETARQAIAASGLAAADIAAVGITNQRETSLVWDRRTGKPLHRSIVWQDRRTADACRRLKDAGHEPMVTRKTGLLLDPYFSGTKLAWLLWQLTGGRVHATDASNAAVAYLVDRLCRRGFSLLDVQWTNAHTRRLGASDIPRTEYVTRLMAAVEQDATFS